MSAGDSIERDWSFLREPFWIFSHVFALSVVTAFLFFCFGWQVPRHFARVDENVLIEARAFGEPIDVVDAIDEPIDMLEFTAVSASGRYIEPALVRVANRSQKGQAGDWLVGLFETSTGELVLVNRGFITRDAVPSDPVEGELLGWLRESRERERFGATDTGEGDRIPRLDIDAIGDRFEDRLGGRDLAPMWIQLASPTLETSFPEPVPLPELNSGPHLSYAVQWFIFAALGLIVYGLLLRKRAGERPQTAVDEAVEDYPASHGV